MAESKNKCNDNDVWKQNETKERDFLNTTTKNKTQKNDEYSSKNAAPAPSAALSPKID